MHQQRHLHATTFSLLEERSVTVRVAHPRTAVERYNDGTQSRPVGRLFHSTC
jgi:hypothetical protein